MRALPDIPKIRRSPRRPYFRAGQRPAVMRDYAAQAGYTRIDVLPVEHDLWRFYHLQNWMVAE